MYDELYLKWKRELESKELQKLPQDFYHEIADYFRKIREDSRMLDRKSVKAKLLETEMKNVKYLVGELIKIRYKKLVSNASEGQKLPLETLLPPEDKIFNEFSSITEIYQNFIKALFQGHILKTTPEHERKMVVLRFLSEIPEIIGSDMKVYGPFKVEDVASLPVQNAEILVKQGLAEKIEII